MKPLLLTERPARRGFLRSLIAAPAAALATHKLILPAQALVTPGDAAARLAHHVAGTEKAFRELYPEGEIFEWGNHRGEGDKDLEGRFVSGDLGGVYVLQFRTIPDPPVPEDIREMVDRILAKRGWKS
ncbi:MAG: hypothetical protein ACR652_05320 [Methylocystis sp.]|uniref:hypothetical protein n=1 Tax=Methylocystis sp. TaxID=1911079 RepID=UPI003DA51F99